MKDKFDNLTFLLLRCLSQRGLCSKSEYSKEGMNAAAFSFWPMFTPGNSNSSSRGRLLFDTPHHAAPSMKTPCQANRICVFGEKWCQRGSAKLLSSHLIHQGCRKAWPETDQSGTPSRRPWLKHFWHCKVKLLPRELTSFIVTETAIVVNEGARGRPHKRWVCVNLCGWIHSGHRAFLSPLHAQHIHKKFSSCHVMFYIKLFTEGKFMER